MIKLKPDQIYEITWTDCFGSGEWVKKADLPVPPEIHSVGYFIAAKNEGFYFASGIDTELNTMDMLAPFFVPSGVIRKIRRLK